MALPPFRMVLVSPRELPAAVGLPEGMVTTLKLGSGRLNASNPAWKALLGLVEDESVRAVVVSGAPPGTAALFTELKELRPELQLLALLPLESPLVIQAAADIVLDFDHPVRAYSSALIAARMGRTALVALSMPGSGDDWRRDTRLAVLRAAGSDMGLAFKSLAVNPDGLEKALQELGIEVGTGTESGTAPAAGMPGAAAARTAIVVNDGRLASEALRIAADTGAMYLEMDRPVDAYTGSVAGTASSSAASSAPEPGVKGSAALGTTSAAAPDSSSGDPVRALIDAARSVPGRPGLTLVWPGEQASMMELGALVLAASMVDGKPASEANLVKVMNTVWPAGQWHASYYVDSQTGVRARNHLLTGADPYLVGRSYLSSESRTMPVRYRQVVW